MKKNNNAFVIFIIIFVIILAVLVLAGKYASVPKTPEERKAEVMEIVFSEQKITQKQKENIINTLTIEQEENYGYTNEEKLRIVNYLNSQ